MKVHRLAKYFPQLEGKEFDLLVEDIRNQGQIEPIVMIGDEILDGVNRYRACQKLGIEPPTKQFNGGDPLAYVIAVNVRRRHLNESQRAMLATEMLPEFEKDAKKRQATSLPDGKRIISTEKNRKSMGHTASMDAGEQFGISRISVDRAKRIKAQAPEKVDEIVKGRASVKAVDAELRAAKQQEKKATKAIKQHPKIVKEYLESIRTFREKIKLAIAGAKRERFAPEAIHMLRTKHSELKSLMEVLENECSNGI